MASGDSGREPIAVVGIGCRFPGQAGDLESFGALIESGRSVIRPVPADRWPAAAGEVGGFLDDIRRFDADYFGISPREARSMDPQQRLLLEVAWEAMSDSGRPRGQWRGSRTAVFVGMLAGDYNLLHAKTLGTAGIGPHYASGVEFSFAAGRLAYAFDLRGAACALNSACSSSLLAVHLAAQSLRDHDCDTALAGGVNLLVTPELSVFMARIGAVSPTGRCRPFDAGADGVVRGEGCGVLVLKRLSDALSDGDRIHAVVRGSAVNHDGFSMGLTAPNSAAQRGVLERAVQRAGLEPDDVDFVEAHGTGTPLGDQIELGALAEVYGTGRPAGRPLLVGSHKAVFGHADAAAGIAGLIKAIRVVGTGNVPAQPQIDALTAAIDWDHAGIAVPLAPTGLRTPDRAGRPLRAAVSAFGLSGTNVHLIVEAPPLPEGAADARRGGPYVALASAHHRAGLAAQVAGLRERLSASAEADDGSARDLLASAATRRTHEAYRFAVVAPDRAALVDALAADGASAAPEALEPVAVDPDAPGPVFVYSGQGSQWPGMAADLYEDVPAVRAVLDACDELIRRDADWSLVEELRRTRGSRLTRTDVAQPAVFAIQAALTAWLAESGVAPVAVIGHSVGEVAAAHAAGCLSLAEAVRLVVRRGQLLQLSHGTGRMVAAHADAETVRAALAAIGRTNGESAVIAAVNGPDSVVLAGTRGACERAVKALTDHGVRCAPVAVEYPFHSPLVARHGPQLRRALAGLRVDGPRIRFLSSVEPESDIAVPGPDYWERNLTLPVLLWPAVDRLLAGAAGHTLVEIGPHPVLARPLLDAVRRRGGTGGVVSTLRRDRPGTLALHQALARLHVHGVAVDWEQVTGRPRRYRGLPAPRWAGESHWLPGVTPGAQHAASAARVPARIRVSLLDADGRVISESTTQTAPAGDGTPIEDGAPAEKPIPAGATAAEPVSISPAPAAPGGQMILQRVDTAVRDVLGLGPDARIPSRRGLFELGLDSLTAVELRARLERESGSPLPATVVFEHPTVADLAAYLASLEPVRVLGTAPVPGGGPRLPDEGAATDGAGIAVIGLACRLPGAASPDELWELLAEGRTTAGDPPPGRELDPSWAQAGADVPVRGSYLDDVEGFDAPFFRVAPREARSLDPQQRLALELGWEALEDAGLPARLLAGRRVGVYLGLNTADYQQLLARDTDNVDLYYGTGTSFAAAAGRLSYFLGLRGPSIAVDTACSSSLTAVHLACQGLREGDAEVALVAGANVIIAPTVNVAMSAGGALAPDGRCKTFDEQADGYGRGEGAVALVLKPLAAARRDGDRVYAVIRGSAVNQDGASGGLTVPSGAAQTAVIRHALDRAGWAPATVDYVEAHGTGTPLGDPIEVRALAEALGEGRPEREPVLLGSAKANLGHLEAAAGAAGLLKAILAVDRGELPPHPIGQPSSRIDWQALPVELVAGRRPWPERDHPRRAGVSAFGFTGTNAHVLVEQAGPPAREPRPDRADTVHELPVTGATESAMRAAAARMARRLRASRPDELADIVYTATFRRSRLDHLATVVGADAGRLAGALEEVAAGRVPAHARIEHLSGDEAPAPAVEPSIHDRGRVVSLPAYPWERQRHWYREPSGPGPRTAVAVASPPLPPDERLFTVRWQPIDPPDHTPDGYGTWALLGGDPRYGDEVALALEKHGARAIRVTGPGGDGGADSDGGGDRAGRWRSFLEEWARTQADCRGVVLLPGADPDCAEALALAQGFARAGRAPGRLWFVTAHAHDPSGSGRVDQAQAALWELGRVLAMELPGRWGGLVDAPEHAPAVASALLSPGRLDDQICVRDGGWFAARLDRATRIERSGDVLDPRRWHVLLGTSASAGPALTALARAGAQRVLLCGISPIRDAAAPPGLVVEHCAPADLPVRLAALEPLGDVLAVQTPTRTTALQDVDPSMVRTCLAETDTLIEECETARRHRPRRITVAVAAAPGWGSVNTAAVAAAAGRLAGWARTVPGAGVLGLMPRADTGELAPEHEPLFTQTGLRLLDPDEVADLMRDALIAAPGDATAAGVDLGRYVKLCQDLAPRAFLAELESASRPAAALATQLAALPAAIRAERMLDHVIAAVADALGLPAAQLDPGTGFFDLGMDSVMSLGVRSQLEESLGLDLPGTLTFEYPNALRLADHLLTQLDDTDTDSGIGTDDNIDTDDLLGALDAAMAAADTQLAGDEHG